MTCAYTGVVRADDTCLIVNYVRTYMPADTHLHDKIHLKKINTRHINYHCGDQCNFNDISRWILTIKKFSSAIVRCYFFKTSPSSNWDDCSTIYADTRYSLNRDKANWNCSRSTLDSLKMTYDLVHIVYELLDVTVFTIDNPQVTMPGN